MFKKIFNSKNEEFKINEQLTELLHEHGFETDVIGNKIVPNFKEKIEIETWVIPNEKGKIVQTRLDVGVKFQNGKELYEAFSDIGNGVNDCVKKNIENFCNSCLHVFIDAFNDTNTYTDQEKWQIGITNHTVFIGNFNVKAMVNKDVNIPPNLLETIKNNISWRKLDEDYYFVRFFYAHHQNKTIATEFMINNRSYEEQNLAELDWENSMDYYSVRNFIILKKVQ